MYQINITQTAQKQLNNFDKQLQLKLLNGIQGLKIWQGNILKMHDIKHEYRLRIGNYRILFILEHDIIYIVNIDNRKDIYKQK